MNATKRINANASFGTDTVRNAGAKVIGCAKAIVTDPSFSRLHSYHQGAARLPVQPIRLTVLSRATTGRTLGRGYERRMQRRRLPMPAWSGSELS